jgi:uncharacterized membrane protein
LKLTKKSHLEIIFLTESYMISIFSALIYYNIHGWKTSGTDTWIYLQFWIFICIIQHVLWIQAMKIIPIGEACIIRQLDEVWKHVFGLMFVSKIEFTHHSIIGILLIFSSFILLAFWKCFQICFCSFKKENLHPLEKGYKVVKINDTNKNFTLTSPS